MTTRIHSLTWARALFVLWIGPAVLAACSSSSDAPPATGVSDAASPFDATSFDAGADAADPRIARLLSVASAAVQNDGVVGAAIALVIDGKLTYAGGIGQRGIGGAPVDEDTRFVVGSTTKMLTAATVLSLVEDGKLDLEAPLTTYLPGLKVESPFDVRAMTLSGLLSHTDGLEDNNSEQCSLARFSAYGARGPVTLWAAPGTVFDYSNDDMALAAQAIEAVVGAGAYEQAVHDRVFAPAGMTTATFDAAAATLSNDIATGYLADPSGAFTLPVPIAMTTSECPIAEPAGYAIASARDFGKFVETLLAGGGAMLRPATVTRMETGIVSTGYKPNFEETYGYGLFIDQIGGETVIDHGGDVPPFHSVIAFVPQARFGIAALINTDSPTTLSTIANTAIGLFAPPPAPVAPPIKTPPSEWDAYSGFYADPYGLTGAFSLTVDDASLAVTRPDGASVGALVQANGDLWILPPTEAGVPALAAVFWRDDGGAVQQVVTRLGIATREDASFGLDAGVGD